MVVQLARAGAKGAPVEWRRLAAEVHLPEDLVPAIRAGAAFSRHVWVE